MLQAIHVCAENSPRWTDRQIPYAIGQFTVNEFCHELAFRQLSEESKRNMGPSGRYTIALGSGILAGFAAAILSHVCCQPIYHMHRRF